MTKNLRRILAVALVFTMLACSFAGCKKSNNKKKSNSSTASTSSVDSSSGADSTSDDDTADNSDIPIDNIDDPVPVHPAAALKLRRVKEYILIAGRYQLKITDIREKVRLHDP